MLALALLAITTPAAISAERFTPSITPTHLPIVNGIAANAMLLTRTSMPPGLTASSPAYVAPTAEQLADEHAAWAWIHPSVGAAPALPLAFIVSRVCEILVANLGGSHGGAFFALRYFNGSVQVFEAAGAFTDVDTERFNPPFWMPSLYSEMTAGQSHMCFLTLDQHVECFTSYAVFFAPEALMASRSNVSYTQLSAASRFTCGLRAVDQLVECFGAAGRDITALIPMNYTSTSVRTAHSVFDGLSRLIFRALRSSAHSLTRCACPVLQSALCVDRSSI